jgi:hypothetical protein
MRRGLAALLLIITMLVVDARPVDAYCAGVVWRRAAISVTFKWVDVTNHCGRRYGTVVWQQCGMFEWFDSRTPGGCY